LLAGDLGIIVVEWCEDSPDGTDPDVWVVDLWADGPE
jgi:hypothetical protein